MSKGIFEFDFEAIEKLADIVKDRELEEITLGDGDKIITVRGKVCPPPPMSGAPVPVLASASPETSEPSEDAPEVVSGNVVKAPIVGTFYAAPSPDDEPYVTVGKAVKKGDVIFIIESMKVMSEVTSDFDGVVKEIMVKNGDALEFDQPIMIIG